jgi:hypothetical protein
MILPKYEYSFGVKDYPVGQIVSIARRDISIPDQPWVEVGSYFSMKKRILPRSCYNAGVNAMYERMRERG